jgi:hypothetical protein
MEILLEPFRRFCHWILAMTPPMEVGRLSSQLPRRGFFNPGSRKI